MMTNAEIRREARGILRQGWYWRISTVLIAFYALLGFVDISLRALFKEYGLQTWTDFIKTKFSAARSGLDLVLPSTSLGWSMTGVSLFERLALWLFGGILLFALATVLLKAIRNDQEKWFTTSFGGFARPFGVLMLVVTMNISIFLWSLLLIVPGIVAMYRYRQAWYLKCDHPEWGALECMDESGRLMKGHKWQAFSLDASFIGWILLASFFLGGVFVLGTFSQAAGAFAGLVVFCGFFYLIVYVLTARAVFYREVKAECPAES